MKKIILLFVLLANIIFTIAEAADAFVVKKIDIQGLQRISAETVYSYLPIRTGQTLRPDQTSAVIKALYNTGFFDHITLARSGNTLIITLVERPTIGQLKISGNNAIPKDKLTTVMTSVNVAEGRVFDRAMLEKIQQSLLNQYYELGRYNARVDTTVTPMERNRVLVKIDISEGLVAKVRRINIIGNHAFTEKELDKQLTLTTPGILTFFTQTDRYSQEKLDSSVENLRNYYLDHGYVKFAVKSSQVAITPDRKSIYLTIVIDEGDVYKIKDVNLKGDLILPKE
ncbi:MAG: outer membrane protein assembly factor BamA, partial [Gammaproteobacteria bacterium]|nr:outer membrane protein assembly factor BamA [Gammaproteobacteria bacterium]